MLLLCFAVPAPDTYGSARLQGKTAADDNIIPRGRVQQADAQAAAFGSVVGRWMDAQEFPLKEAAREGQ